MRMPIIPTPTPPGLTSPSFMWSIGSIPPSGVKLSCMQLTEPLDVPVVEPAHIPHVAGPKRISLPSRLPPDELAGGALVDADGGEVRVAGALGDHREHRHGQPDRRPSRRAAPGPASWSRSCTPNVTTRANGMSRIDQFSMKLVMPVGFSNGWAELALKNPPPFVPSCLMAIWLATGPPGIDWTTVSATAASIGVASVWPARFCTTPPSDSSDGDDERQRQQDAQRGAGEVDPEVAERAPAAPADAADDGDGDGHARRPPTRSSAPTDRPSASGGSSSARRCTTASSCSS